MTTPLVTVCRDCCCGSAKKHPDVDHGYHLEVVRAGVAGHARFRVADCLDVCERSNVVVVQPSPEGKRRGARGVWLGEVLSDEAVDAVVDWTRAGGPGAAAMPEVLRPLVMPRPATKKK